MASTPWNPLRELASGLYFSGVTKLFDQLDELVTRPFLWWREKQQPFIYLIPNSSEAAAPDQHKNTLAALEDRLHHGKRVPVSRVDARQQWHSDVSIKDLLNKAVVDFSTAPRRARQIDFPHYSIALWLAGLSPRALGEDQPDKVARTIDKNFRKFIWNRTKSGLSDSEDQAPSVVENFPWYVRVLVGVAPQIWMMLAHLLWRPPRWFARHELTKAHHNFRQLAREFAERKQREVGIKESDIDRLLVDAFLEDIRQAYRRSTLLGRGRRRTMYPVLLIENAVSGSPTLNLFRLLRDSRTERTGRTT